MCRKTNGQILYKSEMFKMKLHKYPPTNKKNNHLPSTGVDSKVSVWNIMNLVCMFLNFIKNINKNKRKSRKHNYYI